VEDKRRGDRKRLIGVDKRKTGEELA